MSREAIIEIYLFLLKILSFFMNIFPVKNKVTFIMSYGENLIFIYDEIQRQKLDCDVIFLYKPTCKYKMDDYPNVKSIKFESKNVLHVIRSIYHLSTSSYIIIDNYFGSLANLKFKEGVQCIQIWHAAGAIKKFGLLAPSFNKRSIRAQKRFLSVYKKFHKIVVGSDELAEIYKDAFALSEENILKTGIPRTDLFFNEKRKNDIRMNILMENPFLKEKKVILYAPTFRDKELQDFNLHLEIDKMYRELKDEYVLLVRLHPAVRKRLSYQNEYKNFLYDCSLYPNINELFLVTDILVTDYSSVPFEFCLLKKPMIFYPYDLNKYAKGRGIIGEYTKNVPGTIVNSTDDLIYIIKNQSYDIQDLEEFNSKWSKYSYGNSSENLVGYLFDSKP